MGAPVVGLARRVRILEEVLDGAEVSVVAAREGLHPMSIYRWVSQAGLRTSPWGRIIGMPAITTPQGPSTTQDAIHAAAAILRISEGLDLLEDPQVLARVGQVKDRSPRSLGLSISAPRYGHGRRLTVADRAIIQVGVDAGLCVRAIARLVRCAASTITRELRAYTQVWRNQKVYSAAVATAAARGQRGRAKTRKLDDPANAQLRSAVIELLDTKHSPQEVTGRLKVLFPDNESMRVSHESIYQALYVQGKGGLRHELSVEKALRSGRTRRKPASKLPAKTNRSWIGNAVISNRPPEAQDRAVPGHWEGDLVVGPNCSGIITLVERSTRFVLLGRLPAARDSETVTGVLQTMIQDLPVALKRSITWDQGMEMAQHARFTVATGVPVFMCDPHSPWQRGTNENTNGLLRIDYYPKGTDFNEITDHHLKATADQLNRRARATLHFHTPAEKLNELLENVALTP